jgi:pimeloyl-ACP methyl ester carboxylesterase
MYMASSDSERRPSSRWTDIDGPFHYLDYGGPVGGPVLVCLHGLSGSSESWAPIAPTLARTSRVLAVDLVGFGRTVRRGRSVTLPANQSYLDRFLRQVVGTPAILVGHSMGATIATLQAAKHPETTSGLVLINPAVPWKFRDPASAYLAGALGALALAAMTLPRAARRDHSKELQYLVSDFLRIRYANAPTMAVKVVRDLAATPRSGDHTAHAGTRPAFRSLVWTLARRWRFAALARHVRAPVLLLHGDRDRFVPPSAIAAIVTANPSWVLHVAEGVGHFPALEAPEWTINRIVPWLAGMHDE